MRLGSTRLLLAVGVASSCIIVLAGGRLPTALRAVLVLAGTGAVFIASRRDDLTLRAVCVAVGVAISVAVAMPPQVSHDVWAYVMYGREVVHGFNPYTHVPADLPSDPFLARVAAGWRHTPAVYGPGFVALTALGARITHDSATLARLWFQVLAAGALVSCLVLIWRRTRDPGAVAWLGLQPVIIVTIVNQAHNDLLVGVALLAAVLALTDGKPRVGGLYAGLAVLVKVTAGLAVGGLALWLVFRRAPRTLAQFLGTAVGLTLAGNLVFGQTAIRALGSNARLLSRASLWQLPRPLLGITAPPSWSGLSPHRYIDIVSKVAPLSVCVLAIVVIARWLRGRPAPILAGAATASFPVAAAYTLPWYSGWAMPLFALDRRSPLALFVAAHAALLLAVYQMTPDAFLETAPLVQGLVKYLVPVAVFVGYLAACRLERGQPAATSGAPAAIRARAGTEPS